MKFTVLTLFPEYFTSPLSASLVGKAIESKTVHVNFVHLREFGEGKHRSVDARPFGGGPGMVLMPEVVEKAMAAQNFTEKPYVVFLSPQGNKLNNDSARAFAAKKHIVLLCGHYEGIDERIIEEFVDEEVSIGDFVLTGGEPAALVFIDAVSRFIPSVIGDDESVSTDSFEGGVLKGPAYTRPQAWRGREVPAVLLSGNHGEIEKWRKKESLERTAKRRPDLLKK